MLCWGIQLFCPKSSSRRLRIEGLLRAGVPKIECCPMGLSGVFLRIAGGIRRWNPFREWCLLFAGRSLRSNKRIVDLHAADGALVWKLTLMNTAMTLLRLRRK